MLTNKNRLKIETMYIQITYNYHWKLLLKIHPSAEQYLHDWFFSMLQLKEHISRWFVEKLEV